MDDNRQTKGNLSCWLALAIGFLLDLSFNRPVTQPYYRLDRQQKPPLIQREFRGAWVTTYLNLDWPSKASLPEKEKQDELLRIFNRASELNLNAIIFQVRPEGDAFYLAANQPWSKYWTGLDRQPPEPLWDPLEWSIAFAKNRGLELHAWFNPFRVYSGQADGKLPPTHIVRTNPEFVRKFDRYLWLDPGLPAARSYAIDVIMDVVRRYDVDGIHIDDYFYPPPRKGISDFPDKATFERYQQAGGRLQKAEWRRDNINRFVRDLYQAAKETKPWVRVGVSPRGIWRPNHPPGISGADNFNDISADSRLWLRKGWLDYFSPQLYWSISSARQSFPKLLNWWEEQNIEDRHLWPGIATYQVEKIWPNTEILNQLSRIRLRSDSPGALHFRMQMLMNPVDRSLGEKLRTSLYAGTALPPAMTWLEPQPPKRPKLQIENNSSKSTVTIAWAPADKTEIGRWLVQTRFGQTWKSRVVPSHKKEEILTLSEKARWPQSIAITAIDRYGNASPPITISRP